MTPLYKNLANKIRSPSKKTQTITLATEVCTLNFFPCVVMTGGAIPLIVFLSLGCRAETGLHHQLLFLTEKHLHASHCTGEFCTDVISRCLVFEVGIFGTHLVQTFLYPSSLMMAMCHFSSLCCGTQFMYPDTVIIPISTSTYLLVCIISAMAG